MEFRAWDKDRQEMHYGKENDCTIATNLFGQTYYCDFLNYNTGNSDHLDYVDNDRFILMRSTGLKDKQGKEIYFDDLRKHTDSFGERIGKIAWCERMCSTCLEYKDGSATFGGKDLFEGTEYVGNIHENPELFEAEARKEDNG